MSRLYTQYRRLYVRLRKAITSGRFARWAVLRQHTLLARLRRYEKQVMQYSAAAGLLTVSGLPAMQAQIVRVGSETQVNTSSGFYYLLNPEIAMNRSGRFVVVWDGLQTPGNGNVNDYNVYARVFDSAGVAIGQEFMVNAYTTNEQSQSAVAMDDVGNFVVAWRNEKGVWARLFDANGVPNGADLVVDTTVVMRAKEPCVAMDASGNFVVGWVSASSDSARRGIYLKRFSQGGQQSTVIQVNEYPAGLLGRPDIGMTAAGTCVIAWECWGQDGNGAGIYARLCDSLANPQGNEFQANVYTFGNQARATVAMDDDGDFVIGWEYSYGQFFAGSGRSFDANGVPLSGDFGLSETIGGVTRREVDIAMTGNDALVSTMRIDFRSGSDGYDVYAQAYTLAGEDTGLNMVVNSSIPGNQITPSIAAAANGSFAICWGDTKNIYVQQFKHLVSVGEESGPESIQVYPNPAQDNIMIKGEIEQVTIYNLQGQVVYAAPSAAPSAIIDLSAFPAGLYFLRLDRSGYPPVFRPFTKE